MFRMNRFTMCAAADFHLGMRFSSYPSVQKELIRARFSALRRVVDRANAEQCALLVIAGDLFDRINIPVKEAEEVIEILGGFQGDCIAVLPGNHDYFSGAKSGVWKTVTENGPDNLLLLSEKKKYYLNDFHLPVVLYAGPCSSQHGRENAVSWIGPADRKDRELFHIGVAHGSIEGISPDVTKQYFPMNRKQLESAGLDLWIIGHTHIPFPEREETVSPFIIPGTPEPDGFDSGGDGAAWIISVNDNKAVHKKRFTAGSYRFTRQIKEIHSAGDIEEAVREMSGTAGPSVLLQLKLRGTLVKGDFPLLGPAMEELAQRFFYTDIDTESVKTKLTPGEIGNEFREGTFPYILLSRLSEYGDTEALERAYRILEEMRK
jgi:DNA repair protein SbcD/Mre11